MNISISNGRHVLSAGTIVSINDEQVRFSADEGFVVGFRFVHDDRDRRARSSSSVENNELIVTFTNFESSTGYGNREALALGDIGNRTILLNYAIYYIGTSANHTRVIHYTFMDEVMARRG